MGLDGSFHQFAHLPTELRLKIWGAFHAQTPSRIIPIYVTVPIYFLDLSHPNCISWPHIISKAIPVPPILHINREARSFGLEHYKSSVEVSQSLSSVGSWWRSTNTSPYELCQHEKEARERWGALGDYTYWDKRKDVFLLEQREKPWQDTVTSTSIWSGMCDIRFESIRWLAMPYTMFSIWVDGVSTNTIFTGMEVVFVVLGVEAQRRSVGPTGPWTKESFMTFFGRKIEKTWQGSKAGEAPQVTLVGSFEEMTEEIEKRFDA